MIKKLAAIFLVIFAVSIFSVDSFAANTEISLSCATAEPGETVEIELVLENNPGIVSANLKVDFDEGLTLVDAANGDTFSTLTYIPPKRLSSGEGITSSCQFAWTGFDIADEDICDGKILTLVFEVPDDAEDGDCFEINISSNSGDVIDRDLNSVVLSAQTYIDIHKYEHAHSYTSAVTKKPTCTKAGTRTYTCSCGDSYTEAIPAAGHKETILKAVTATCTSTGLTEGKKCSVCGTITVAQKTVAKLAHKEVTVVGKSATYTSTGLTEGKKCSVCGTITVKQNTIAKLDITKSKVDGLKAKKVKVAKSSEITLAWASLGEGVKYEIYQKNGKKWKKLKTTSSTSYTVKKLKADKEYQFRVRAVVDDIKGKYSSTLKVETIPETTTLKLKAGKKQLTASWSKVSDISGYEVQYSTSKKMKDSKKTNVKKSSKKTTIKSLKKGKKYYVRIRTYKTVNGKKIYSDWSKVKNVKVK